MLGLEEACDDSNLPIKRKWTRMLGLAEACDDSNLPIKRKWTRMLGLAEACDDSNLPLDSALESSQDEWSMLFPNHYWRELFASFFFATLKLAEAVGPSDIKMQFPSVPTLSILYPMLCRLKGEDDGSYFCGDDPHWPHKPQWPLGFVPEVVPGPRQDREGQLFEDLPLYLNSLLLPNGHVVSFDHLRDKYLLICCVSLPLLAGSLEDTHCRTFIAAHSLLPPDSFEMVLVVNTGCEEPLFDYCRSGFSCPAVPFSHFDTRHHLWSYLSEGSGLRLRAVLVNPNGDILHHSDTIPYFTRFGVEGFPHTYALLDMVEEEDDSLVNRLVASFDRLDALNNDFPDWKPLSLHEDLLQCAPSRCLKRCGNPDQQISVSDLSKKYVGLYLCLDGKFMRRLKNAYSECQAQNKDIEIVVICLPIFDNPHTYLSHLTEALRLCQITSWLIFPFDSKVSRRLWRVFAEKGIQDKFVILPPTNTKSPGELQGREVVHEFGASAYPFVKGIIARQTIAALREITSASLFYCSENQTNLVKHNNNTNTFEPVSQSLINGKRLLLFLDMPDFSRDNGELYRLLKEHYSALQEINCEVVFIPLLDCGPSEYISEMEWLLMDVKGSQRVWVIDQLRYLNLTYRNLLVGMDSDGHIVSFKTKFKLIEDGVTESLFDYSLDLEIIHRLYDIYSRY